MVRVPAPRERMMFSNALGSLMIGKFTEISIMLALNTIILAPFSVDKSRAGTWSGVRSKAILVVCECLHNCCVEGNHLELGLIFPAGTYNYTNSEAASCTMYHD